MSSWCSLAPRKATLGHKETCPRKTGMKREEESVRMGKARKEWRKKRVKGKKETSKKRGEERKSYHRTIISEEECEYRNNPRE